MLHPRASFANVMSCLALFVALGGASYAAVSLPNNSVGAKQNRTPYGFGNVDAQKREEGMRDIIEHRADEGVLAWL